MNELRAHSGKSELPNSREYAAVDHVCGSRLTGWFAASPSVLNDVEICTRNGKM